MAQQLQLAAEARRLEARHKAARGGKQADGDERMSNGRTSAGGEQSGTVAR